MKTDKNTVIGGYCPDQWEDTSDMECSKWDSGYKDIVSGSPFLFYWVNDEIQIIKNRDYPIPWMRSDKVWLMDFGGGLMIKADENGFSVG